MNKRAWRTLMLLVGLVALSVLALAPAATANGAVLWEQEISRKGGWAIQLGANLTQLVAEDFSNAEPWTITKIYLPVFTRDSNPDIPTFTWAIYAGDGSELAGTPVDEMAEPFWTITLDPSDSQVDIQTPGWTGFEGHQKDLLLTLDTPIQLPAGHWWLVPYGNSDAADHFAAFWWGSSHQEGCTAVSGWYDSNDWSAITESGMAFRLEGGPTRTLTYTAGPGGTIVGEATQTVAQGSDGTEVEAEAYSGYHFVDWSDGVTTAERTDTGTEADLAVTAEFALNEYTVSVAAMPAEGGSVLGGSTYLYGEEVTVEAIPSPGYRFEEWVDADDTGHVYGDLPTYTFSCEADISLVARFIRYHTLTYTAGPGGTITGVTTQEVDRGANGTTVTAVPDPGHYFTGWSDGLTTASRTDTDVAADLAVTANFRSVPKTTDRWSDISRTQWMTTYGISQDQAYAVAQGYTDGTFRPGLPLTRAHCAKMIVDGFGIDTSTPTEPTFSDVPASHPQYAWIEGGYSSEVLSGYADGTYRPDSQVSRQQFNTMLARVLVKKELKKTGHIRGTAGDYPTLAEWYAAEGEALLGAFTDASLLYQDHKATTAYLVLRGVVQGGERDGLRYLDALTVLTRAQAVAMIVRAGEAAGP